MKYPYDVNRPAQLMNEAGYTKDSDGLFVDGQGNRSTWTSPCQDASEIERMQQVQSDTWRRAGFDVRDVVMGIQLFTQLERRQTLPGFSYAAGETEATYLTSQIGKPGHAMVGPEPNWVVQPGIRPRLRVVADDARPERAGECT